MSSYFEWPLPLNPPNPYNTYLHSLAPMQQKDRRVYYTKYIIGIIGELDVTKKMNNVREWVFPRQLYTSTMTGGHINLVSMDRDPKSNDSLWCLLQDYHGAIINFNSRNGLFTRFTTKVPQGPLLAPQDLKFDGMGILWFVSGSGAPGKIVSAICSFNPRTQTVAYWDVPDKVMRNIVSVFPNSRGTKVWVSSVDPNYNARESWIGCLDVGTNIFTTYIPPDPQINPPRSIDIVLGAKDSVWFTADKSAFVPNPSSFVPGIFRLDLNSNQIFKYVTDPNISRPRFIAIDQNEQAWVTDINLNSIIFCDPAKSCATVNFSTKKSRLKPEKLKLLSKEAGVEPITSTSLPKNDSIIINNYPCAKEFKATAISYPDQIQIQSSSQGQTQLYFVCFGSNKIGMLEP